MAIWENSLPQVFSSAHEPVPPVRRYMPGAPEVYLSKVIDNSRLVRQRDARRTRDLLLTGVALALMLVLALVYVVQHVSAIQYGYKIEELRHQRDELAATNAMLRIEQSTLTDPARLEKMAIEMGMTLPQAGQVRAIEVPVDPNSPVMARAGGVAVVSGVQ